MKSIPNEWFQVLGADRELVSHVGTSLIAYANSHEQLPDPEDESQEALNRHVLRADTLGDAASLLCLVDQDQSLRAFREAARLRNHAQEPSLEYTLAAFDSSLLPKSRLDDVLTPLAQVFMRVDDPVSISRADDKQARATPTRPTADQSSTGIPSWIIQAFSAEMISHTTNAVDSRSESQLLRMILLFADQTIQAAMDDAWHWRRFDSDLRIVEPELLAIGGAIAAVYNEEPEHIYKLPDTPAWVSVRIGGQMRMRSRNTDTPD